MYTGLGDPDSLDKEAHKSLPENTSFYFELHGAKAQTLDRKLF